MKAHRYIVIRRKLIFDYTEYLGPVYSYPGDIAKDAKELFGKPGYDIRWVALSKATKQMKRLLNKGIV